MNNFSKFKSPGESSRYANIHLVINNRSGYSQLHKILLQIKLWVLSKNSIYCDYLVKSSLDEWY